MASIAEPVSAVRLRQIALVAKDLKRAEHLLTRVLGSEVIYRDPNVGIWGLENILIPIGGDIIEVVSPTKPDTTAGRLLSKRGDGGYMIIMQNEDAAARKSYLESNGLAKVIFTHKQADSICIQYHPKGIKGGMLPELDSHRATPSNPNPVTTRFSPWHACGDDFDAYSAGMKRNAHLQLVGATCRLAASDTDTSGAVRQWRELFGVSSSLEPWSLAFTNMQLDFVSGLEDESEGLVSIKIAVTGKERFNRILDRANKEGICGDGWINMLGVKWFFELVGVANESSKL